MLIATRSLDYPTSLASFTIKQRSCTDSAERVGEGPSRKKIDADARNARFEAGSHDYDYPY